MVGRHRKRADWRRPTLRWASLLMACASAGYALHGRPEHTRMIAAPQPVTTTLPLPAVTSDITLPQSTTTTQPPATSQRAVRTTLSVHPTVLSTHQNTAPLTAGRAPVTTTRKPPATSSSTPHPTSSLPRSSSTSSTTRTVTPKVSPTLTSQAPVKPSSLGSQVVAGARAYIGVPYLYGGITRAGMDCSGLVYTVLRSLGLSPPRTADQQMRWTTRITKAGAGPGDLVFGVTNGRAHHVGVYLGDNMMIDAPDTGSFVGVHHLYKDSTVFGRIPS
jgi:peptidoglycan DL-endopeptidase CwlO